MKFRIRRASLIFDKDPQIASAVQDGDRYFVEIDTLEDLLSLANIKQLQTYDFEPPYELLVSTKEWDYDGPQILVRDDWIE